MMRYLALACDYDETLARGGRLEAETAAALERVRSSGRKLLLVTGRELDDLRQVCGRLDLFDWVVAENGAVLFQPASGQTRPLAEPPPAPFVEALRRRGVTPLSAGRVIVATFQPHETTAVEVIRDFGLDLQVIFNKGSVMLLPAGVTKATGLTAALAELRLSPHNVVAVGDAENDHPFLRLCECGVAVANALPAVKDTADFVTRAAAGAGVRELINELVENDLAICDGKLTRHHLLLGYDADGQPVRLQPYGHSLLIAGPSGSGKSTAANALLERLGEHGYQYCVLDPEGDYPKFEQALCVGDGQTVPPVGEVLNLLERPGQNVIVSLIGLPRPDRPAFFLELWLRLHELRARLGRPHWLVVDETHHLFPTDWSPGQAALPAQPQAVVYITDHPGQVAAGVLQPVQTVLAVGPNPGATLAEFAAAAGVAAPEVPASANGTAVVWARGARRPPFRVHLLPDRAERRRHGKKLIEGTFPPEDSFYFRGPAGKLNLRAQNFSLFLQIGEGVDEETWLHHLRRGDYSAWVRQRSKDEALAAQVERLERTPDLTAERGRGLLRGIIERHFLLSAAGKPGSPAP